MAISESQLPHRHRPPAGLCVWLRAARSPRSSRAPRRSTHRGRLQKVEGRLAKSPSFWVRSVRVRRTYQTVSGHALPVLVESVADVKLAGACEFSMWIDYTAVDGIRSRSCGDASAHARVRAVTAAHRAALTAPEHRAGARQTPHDRPRPSSTSRAPALRSISASGQGEAEVERPLLTVGRVLVDFCRRRQRRASGLHRRFARPVQQCRRRA